ncbi:MAG: hypothetical protein JNM75_02855, partial [Rhodospirillales bacterium]|nr:hypothetical protein [Rhodospirillales bacterium]
MKDLSESELKQSEKPSTRDPEGAAATDAETVRRGGLRRPRRRVILIAVVLALATAGAVYWFIHRNTETTDDAFIDGDT